VPLLSIASLGDQPCIQPLTVAALRDWESQYRLPLLPDNRRGELIRPDDVGGAMVWELLVRDGKLVRLHGQIAVRPDCLLTPELRAAAIADEVPEGFVAAGVTAAWIHCGSGELPTLEFVYPNGANSKHAVQLSGKAWSTIDLAQAVVTIAGVPVTNPQRTIADLAWRHPPEVALQWIGNLVAAGVNLRAAALDMERRHRVVGRDHIRAVLATANTLFS